MTSTLPIETRPVTLNSNQGVVLVRPARTGVDHNHTRVDLVLANGASQLFLDANTAAQLGRILLDAAKIKGAAN